MRFFTWPWKPRLDDEADDEIAFHIDMRTRELVERGLDPGAARQEAERRFGNLTRVRQTCRELGKGVVRLVVGQAMRPLAIGALVGAGAALASSRALSSELFGVSPTDPTTMLLVGGALLVVGLAASALPARRAAALDPTRALQGEWK